MTKIITSQSKRNLFIFVSFVCFVTLMMLVKFPLAFCIGLGISFVSTCVYLIMQARHLRRVPDYPAQALVVVISTMIVRFFIIGAALAWVLTQTALSATTVLLGFVVGQVFFLINQLIMVAKNNGK